MTPADEMRAAAKLLRERATDLTQGHWSYQPGPPCAEVVAEEGGWIIATSRHVEDDDLRWVALMSPSLAPLLVDWLETEANCHGAAQETGRAAADLVDSLPGAGEEKTTFTVVIDTSGPAHAFARAILASAS